MGGLRSVVTAVNHDVALALTQLYRDINDQCAAFQAATGLYCPAGCGQCCETPEIDTSPLDLVPMALELIRRGEAADWLARARHGASTCVFYQADDQIPGNGRCQMYLWRPTICRLFGFAAVTDSVGTPKLAACTRHQQLYPELVAMAQVAIANGLSVPRFADWQIQVAGLDPHWGHHLMPINQALIVAIERVGLALAYATQHPANVVAAAAAVEPDPVADLAPLNPIPAPGHPAPEG